MKLRIEPLSPFNLDKFHALFDACHSSCFCRYWHFPGDKNGWLERSAISPEQNYEEQCDAVCSNDPSGNGLLALTDEEPSALGWVKLAPRIALPKLRRLPVYRNLDLGDDASIFSIGCFLVHPAHRRKGLASALLKGAIEEAIRRGGHAIEAYPHIVDTWTHPEQAWLGPGSMFHAAGFSVVAGENPYPVYRKIL